MATKFRYKLPLEQSGWTVNGQIDTVFTWEYEDGSEDLLRLYGSHEQEGQAPDRKNTVVIPSDSEGSCIESCVRADHHWGHKPPAQDPSLSLGMTC